MALRCILLGHTGNDRESGYHICSKCGQHAYWDYKSVKAESNDFEWQCYERSGLLFAPLWWLVDYASSKNRAVHNRCQDIPF